MGDAREDVGDEGVDFISEAREDDREFEVSPAGDRGRGELERDCIGERVTGPEMKLPLLTALMAPERGGDAETTGGRPLAVFFCAKEPLFQAGRVRCKDPACKVSLGKSDGGGSACRGAPLE